MFYLHIPKTGGQTLSSRLASAYPFDRAHYLQDGFTFPGDVAALREVLMTNDFVETHLTGQVLVDVAVDDVLCTVRDPVAQIVSNYRHIRREPERRLARAAQVLSPGEFFDRFGDFFTDRQTRYLLSAFVPLAEEIERHGYCEALMMHLQPCLDRVRWLVPTECIDEFVPLWEQDTGRRVTNPGLSINHAPGDDVNVAEVRAAVAARPHLFGFDNLLHQIGRSRFAALRAAVSARARPWDWPENASRVHTAGAAGVWLTEGWYEAERAFGGQANWAGPTNRSDVRLRRAPGQDWLTFEVLVVNGIQYDDVRAFAVDGYLALPVVRVALGESRWRYSVDVSELPAESAIALVVPDCFAPINVFGDDDGLERRSFLAGAWALAEVAADVGTPDAEQPARSAIAA